MKKLGLALGSGGSRGVAHIGFLKALEEAALRPDYIAGSSMGAVVGAAFASGMKTDDVWQGVEKLRLFNLISPTRQRGGLFSTRKMRGLLQKHLGDKSFQDLEIPFCCVAVDMVTQKVVEFKEGSLVDAVIASSSIPAVFHPFVKEGMRLVDGGILERVPVQQVKAMGADVVIAVDVLGQRQFQEKSPRVLGTLLEVIDLMDNYRTRRRRRENADVIDMWLEPDLGDMNQYDLKKLQFAYERGYALGVENLPKIKDLLEE